MFLMVEPRGIEPLTSSLRTTRSPNWATAPKKSLFHTSCFYGFAPRYCQGYRHLGITCAKLLPRLGYSSVEHQFGIKNGSNSRPIVTRYLNNYRTLYIRFNNWSYPWLVSSVQHYQYLEPVYTYDWRILPSRNSSGAGTNPPQTPKPWRFGHFPTYFDPVPVLYSRGCHPARN